MKFCTEVYFCGAASSTSVYYLKGGGHGKIFSEFIVQIFRLDCIKTHDTIFKIFGIR